MDFMNGEAVSTAQDQSVVHMTGLATAQPWLGEACGTRAC